MSTEQPGTNCTPGPCSYGPGHACAAVTAHPELFPPGRKYAWRRPSYPIDHSYKPY